MSELLKQTEWRFIDQSGINPHFHALQSFAIDDTLCRSVGGRYSPPTVRAWVHSPTLVLGIQDTKLPDLQAGLHFLREKGYEGLVRNSGGLAVALDEGVLNLSLIFPDTEKGIDINRGYDAMWDLIQRMFADFDCEIKAGEIAGSYCPGSYDLSIDGRKFAGISQRRIRKAVAVQIYLCVTGSGQARAELVKEFYEHAQYQESLKFIFPEIQTKVMASLSELLGVAFSIQAVMQRFLQVMKEKCDTLSVSQLRDTELDWFHEYYERMMERNDKILTYREP
ncbi:lipoate--protein ligase family protein [Lederbergia sp. NSJ-179]|uniref:lipoate--protein ligase family protein n=1 Tax=Lederbergia sp. NSJ-179 TaxID=2931402 RepID=UPI001FD2607C|nr:lipoate--protein ligase family protein [Lederbergia sp. NSJ-179]MCJ7841580.1 lipoate--protein ligase family protein [Lederbergia sp. NSJ-179]